jgi:hypothetical protein
MTSQILALRSHRIQNGVLACMVVATRTVQACTRKAARSNWWLLLSIGVGMLLTVVAFKLVALFGAAVHVSFLRDVGQNVDLPAAWGGLPALLAAWLGWPYPSPPAPGTGPYSPAGRGQYGPFGNPWPGTDSNGVPYNTYIGPGGALPWTAASRATLAPPL